MGGRKTKPAEVTVPKLSEQQVRARFKKRYQLAATDVFRKVLTPQLERLNSYITYEIGRSRLTYDPSPDEIQTVLDKAAKRYIRENPSDLLSSYLRQYPVPYDLGATKGASEKPAIKVSSEVVKEVFDLETERLRFSGKPFCPAHISSLFFGTGTSSSWFVKRNTFQGALAIQVARHLDRYLRKPLNEFRHKIEKQEKPALPLSISVAKSKADDRITIKFSRT